MNAELWLLFLVVGAGTYLARLLPLSAALRRRDPEGSDTPSGLDRTLGLVGPAVIAALLVISVVPDPETPNLWRELLRGLVALVPTCLAAVRWQNLGITVLVGVAAYGLAAIWI
ncbi:AzlD domain-containing protein [Rubrobacter taiwanensis]|uniref:AzlD domain-containing protein n=1 Tax=Rubrobacter taiwanensis TaxID=185139 RepID=UPI00140558DF|nr:AzlD domain-containing protein [Rubrobacter taiwanensis]